MSLAALVVYVDGKLKTIEKIEFCFCFGETSKAWAMQEAALQPFDGFVPRDHTRVPTMEGRERANARSS